jgi:hypothetical protein
MNARIPRTVGLIAAAAVTGAVVGGGVTVALGAPVGTPTTSDAGSAAVLEAETPSGMATSFSEAGDAEGILFMVEEEKLARDVYLTLGDLWGLPIFTNIASAEQRHMDAVLGLVDSYGLAAQIQVGSVGSFANEELQKLHNDLVDLGSQSIESALEVGAIIEEVDIKDLEAYLAATDADDVATVYEKLLRGSRNHLRAFVSQLEAAGVEREPYAMDPVAYAAVLASGTERGRAAADYRDDDTNEAQRGVGGSGRWAGGSGGNARGRAS